MTTRDQTKKLAMAPRTDGMGISYPLIRILKGTLKGRSIFGFLILKVMREIWVKKKAIWAPKLYKSAKKLIRARLKATTIQAMSAKIIRAKYGVLKRGWIA